MKEALRGFAREPRVADPPPLRWWDYALSVLLAVGAVLGGVFEEPLAWRPLAVVLGVALAVGLLWRRVHPFGFSVAVAVAGSTVHLATWVADTDLALTAAMMLVALIATYSLFRWASGREALLGSIAILVLHVVTSFHSDTSLLEGVFGTTFWLFPAAAGFLMRTRAKERLRAVREARVAERHQLARELHDTVAHHMSAIAIQAQAGQALAEGSPERVAGVLATIEEQASLTLTEMRRMVSVLRDDDRAELAPQAGLDDVRAMATPTGSGPAVDVCLTGSLEAIGPALEASVFRFAQEGLTNARRHARHATRIQVSVHGADDHVDVTVADDGDSTPALASGGLDAGFGLVGMRERATALGGSFSAGPGPERGWTVHARLPRRDAST